MLFHSILTDLFVPAVGSSSERTSNDRQRRERRGACESPELQLVLDAFVDYIDHYRYTSSLTQKNKDPYCQDNSIFTEFYLCIESNGHVKKKRARIPQQRLLKKFALCGKRVKFCPKFGSLPFFTCPFRH